MPRASSTVAIRGRFVVGDGKIEVGLTSVGIGRFHGPSIQYRFTSGHCGSREGFFVFKF